LGLPKEPGDGPLTGCTWLEGNTPEWPFSVKKITSIQRQVDEDFPMNQCTLSNKQQPSVFCCIYDRILSSSHLLNRFFSKLLLAYRTKQNSLAITSHLEKLKLLKRPSN